MVSLLIYTTCQCSAWKLSSKIIATCIVFFCSMTFRHFKMWLKWINIFWGHFSALFKVLKRCIWEICQFKSLFTLHIASKQLCRVDVKASTFSILQLGDTFLWGDYAFCYFGHLWWHQNTVFRCNMLMNWYPWSCILC